MPRSKRKTVKVSKTGLEISESYCVKCLEFKKVGEFFDAVDAGLINASGYMSLCKSCLNDLFNKFLASEGSYERATLRLCRAINLKYNEEAINAALKQIETYKERGTEDVQFFGLYKSKLGAVEKSSNRIESGMNLMYEEVTQINIQKDELSDDAFEGAKDVKAFWGSSFSPEELEILEGKFAAWSQSHSIDTQSERVLLKYICLKEFDIDRAIGEGTSTAALTKEFQELLKTSNLAPSSANAASGGKAQETWGGFIKVIEETEPAEYFKDQSLFKDFDNLNQYWQKFVVRSIKNFLTGSRDFSIEDNTDEYDDESDSEEPPKLEYQPEE
jgi:hypothetical protein